MNLKQLKDINKRFKEAILSLTDKEWFDTFVVDYNDGEYILEKNTSDGRVEIVFDYTMNDDGYVNYERRHDYFIIHASITVSNDDKSVVLEKTIYTDNVKTEIVVIEDEVKMIFDDDLVKAFMELVTMIETVEYDVYYTDCVDMLNLINKNESLNK